MAMFRLIVGIILIILIYFAAKEIKKLLQRKKMEEELEQIKAEEDVIEICEEVEIRRLDLEKRKKDIKALQGE